MSERFKEQSLSDIAKNDLERGDLGEALSILRQSLGKKDQESVAGAFVNTLSVSEKGRDKLVENLDSLVQMAMEEDQGIKKLNAREFVVLSMVLLEIQVNKQMSITDTTLGLKRILDSPDTPMEIKLMAAAVMNDVKSAMGVKAFKNVERKDFAELVPKRISRSASPPIA